MEVKLKAPDGSIIPVQLTGDKAQDDKIIQDAISNYGSQPPKTDQPVQTTEPTQTVDDTQPELTGMQHILPPTDVVSEQAKSLELSDDEYKKYYDMGSQNSEPWESFIRGTAEGVPVYGPRVAHEIFDTNVQNMTPAQARAYAKGVTDNSFLSNIGGRIVGELGTFIALGGPLSKLPWLGKAASWLVKGGTTARVAKGSVAGAGYEGGTTALETAQSRYHLGDYTRDDGSFDAEAMARDVGASATLGAALYPAGVTGLSVLRRFTSPPGTEEVTGKALTNYARSGDDAKRGADYLIRTNPAVETASKAEKAARLNTTKTEGMKDVTSAFNGDNPELLASIDNIINTGNKKNKALLATEIEKSLKTIKDKSDYQNFIKYINKLDDPKTADFNRIHSNLNKAAYELERTAELGEALDAKDWEKLAKLGEDPLASSRLQNEINKGWEAVFGRIWKTIKQTAKYAAKEGDDMSWGKATGYATGTQLKQETAEFIKRGSRTKKDIKRYEAKLQQNQARLLNQINEVAEQLDMPKVDFSKGQDEAREAFENIVNKVKEGDEMFKSVGNMQARLDKLRGAAANPDDLPSVYLSQTGGLDGGGVTRFGNLHQTGGFLTRDNYGSKFNKDERAFIRAVFNKDDALKKMVLEAKLGTRYKDLGPGLISTSIWEEYDKRLRGDN